jgi:hypothetical protein
LAHKGREPERVMIDATHVKESWGRSLRQGARVGPSMRRTIAHEDPEAFYGRVQGQGRA